MARMRPSGSRPTISVKVPPRSIQKSHLPVPGIFIAVSQFPVGRWKTVVGQTVPVEPYSRGTRVLCLEGR